jgi:hypothetical protein
MDMNSKMDGSAPVSQILGGVWKIQKMPSTDDQSTDSRKKKNRKKNEDEEKNFEDGRVTDDNEMITGAETTLGNVDDKNENAAKDDSSPVPHKIDIII